VSRDPVRDALMDWVYEQCNGATERDVELTKFANDRGLDEGRIRSLVAQCAQMGLLVDLSVHEGAFGGLTHAGARDVEARRQRREDPALRAAAARNGLLLWFYGQALADVHLPVTERVLESDESMFEGARLTAREVDRAADHLAKKGLIKGTRVAQRDGPVRAEITSTGEDCVEHFGGDVAEWTRAQTRGGTTVTNSIGTFNNHGGAVAVGSTNVNQDVHVGVQADDLVRLTQALLAELPKLGLAPAVQEAARDALDEVGREVEQAEPDTSRVMDAFGRFVGYLADAGKPAVTMAFLALAQHLGLPPG